MQIGMMNVLQQVKQRLAPPTFEDDKKTRMANALQVILLTISAVLLFLAVSLPIFVSDPWPGLGTIGLVLLFAAGALWLMYQGWVREASIFLTVALWVVTSIVAVLFGYGNFSIFTDYLVVILIAGVLLGGRAAVIMALLTIAVSLGILYANFREILPAPVAEINLTVMWITLITQFMAASALLYTSVRNLNRALTQAHQHKEALTKTLFEATVALNTTHSLSEVLDWMLSLLQELIPYDSACLFLLEGEYLRTVAWKGFSDLSQVSGKMYPADTELTLELSRTKRPICLEDAQADPRFLKWMETSYVRGWMGIPLVIQDQMIGYLTLDSRRVGAYGEAEKTLAQTFANQVGAAIEKAQLLDQVKHQAETRKVTSDILHHIDTTPDVKEAFPLVVSDLKESTGCARISLLLFDEKEEMVTFAALGDTHLELRQGMRLPLADFASMSQLQAGDMVLTPDLSAKVDFAVEHTLYGAGYRSQIEIPLSVGGSVMGALSLCWAQLHGYRDVHLPFLVRVVDTLALAIGRKRFIEAKRQQQARTEILHQASNQVKTSLDLDEVLDVIAHQTLILIDVPCCRVGLLESHDELVWKAAAGFPEEIAAVGKQAVDEGLSGWVAIHQHPLTVYDMAGDERVQETAFGRLAQKHGLCSYVGVPLTLVETLVGVIHINTFEPRHFTIEEVDTLRAFAEQAVLAIENARLFAQIQNHAIELEAEVIVRTADLMVINEQLEQEITERERIERTVRQANQRLKAMQAIERAMLTAQSPGAISRIVLDHLYELIPFHRAMVLLFDFKADQAVVLALKMEEQPTTLQRETLVLSQLSSLPYLEGGRAYIVQDLAAEAFLSPTDEQSLAAGIYSYICMPLISSGQLMGALNVDFAHAGPFSSEHQEIMQDVASLMSVVMQQAQLREALQRQTVSLRDAVNQKTAELVAATDTLLYEISERHQLEQKIKESLARRTRQVQTSTEVAQKIAAAPVLDDLFLRVVNLIQERFNYYHVQVYTLEGDDLILQEGTGKVGQTLKYHIHKISLAAPKSLVAQAAGNCSPVLAPDVTQNEHWLPNPLLPETKAEIAVPIMLGNEVLGVLDVQHNQPDTLDEEDQILLMGLCGQIAVAINNRRLEAKRLEAEEALKAHAEQLERSNRELQQSNQELQRFAYVASHDLQEPLRKIQAFSDRLQYKYGEHLGERGNDYLVRMQKSAARMQALINGLLMFTRVSTSAQPFMMIDLNHITNEILDDLNESSIDFDGQIEVGYLPTIDADPVQMRQLLEHLINNAIKYQRPGITPKIKIEGNILNHAPPDKQLCEITIADNGIGLNEKYLDRLFNVFQRLHNRYTYEGTGIGLAVCRKIAERHGGNITAKSKLNEGTTFIVTLPVKQTQNL